MVGREAGGRFSLAIAPSSGIHGSAPASWGVDGADVAEQLSMAVAMPSPSVGGDGVSCPYLASVPLLFCACEQRWVSCGTLPVSGEVGCPRLGLSISKRRIRL